MRRTASPASVVALLLSFLAFAPSALAGPGDLYVTSDASDVVRMYNPTTGAFISNFVSSQAASGMLGISFGATNNRMLVGHWTGGVEEFDATTGGYIKTYNASGPTHWAGVYAPNGNVLIGSWFTNDIREYDPTTGAFIQMLTPVFQPADMKIGPNGNLFVCSFMGGFVMEIDPSNGSPLNNWALPSGSQANDISFKPNGDMIVTAMRQDSAYVYDFALNLVDRFTGTGWGNPHGTEIDPNTGNVLVVDGVSGQVHVFNPVTYVELNPAFLSPPPGDKIVDLAFRPVAPTTAPTTTWGRVKKLYR